MVEDAAGRPDDEGDAALEGGELLAHALPAVDRDAAAILVRDEFGGLLGHLDDEFAGRREDDGLRAGGPFNVSPAVEEGDQKGGGLARARLRLADHVAAGEGFRDQGGLDGGRVCVADSTEGREDIRVQT